MSAPEWTIPGSVSNVDDGQTMVCRPEAPENSIFAEGVDFTFAMPEKLKSPLIILIVSLAKSITLFVPVEVRVSIICFNPFPHLHPPDADPTLTFFADSEFVLITIVSPFAVLPTQGKG